MSTSRTNAGNKGWEKRLSASTLEMKRRVKCLENKMGMVDPLEIF